jgi:hypothetical protein
MATADNESKRTGFGWIPKLSLFAVVIAFGYLYLSSVDKGPADGAGVQMAAGDAGSVEADAGFQQQVMSKLGELTSSAEGVIADAASAGADLFNGAVDKVKQLTGAADESAAETASVEPPVAQTAPAESAAVETAEVEAPAATDKPIAATGGERPAATGFDRHYAPLPAAPVARPTTQQADASQETSAPVAPTEASPPVAETEATVFAESLMSDEAPADTASASTEAGMPMAAPSEQGQRFEPMPMIPVVPQPYAGATTMPAPDARAIERRQEAVAQYQARMMAEYENRRRLADQRAREYWERMQSGSGPMAAPMGYPGYGPAYGPPAYPR